MNPYYPLLAGLILFVIAAYAWLRERGRRAQLSKDLTACTSSRALVETELAAIREEHARAKPYLAVADAAVEAQRIRNEAEQLAASARQDADAAIERARVEAARLVEQASTEASVVSREAREKARERLEVAEHQLGSAGEQARRIVQEAERRAEEVAGDAYEALRDAKHLEQVANAMRNKIEGYGDRYIVPSYSFLDELAETYGFAEAGRELRSARERSSLMVEHERAAECDYVEQNRREYAIRFVLDAFNGKVDSILSRTCPASGPLIQI